MRIPVSCVALAIAGLGCTVADAQFKRPPPEFVEQAVSPRLKITIMTRPSDKTGGGMLAFSPDAKLLYIGSGVIGAVPQRPVPPKKERDGAGGSTAGATVTATSDAVADGTWIGAPDVPRRKRLATEAPVVMGGSVPVGASTGRQSNAVAVHRVSDGEQVRIFQPREVKRPSRMEPCTSALLSYDGRLLALFGKVDVFLAMYDTATGKLLFQIPRKTLIFNNPWGSTAFTQDSAALLTVRRHVVTMFDAATGKFLDQEDLGNHSYASSLHTSRVAKRFFYGNSVWNSETVQNIAPQVNPRDSGAQAICAVSSDGRVMLGAAKSSAFAIHDGKLVELLDGFDLRKGGEVNEPWVTASGLTDDGRCYAAAYGEKIFLGSLCKSEGRLSPSRLETLEGHLQTVDRLAFSRDGRLLASTSTDGSTRVWDVADITADSDAPNVTPGSTKAPGDQ